MGVYEILAITSPILGIFAFGSAQIVVVLLLRRRFMRVGLDAPLQKQLQFGLYAGLVVCAVLWIVVFLICARAVLYETMAGNLVPLPLFAFVLACAFAGLITVSWFSMRHFAKELEALAAEYEEKTTKRGGLHIVPPQSPVSDSDTTQLKKKARRAVLYLGASNYGAMLELFSHATTVAR